MNELIGVSEFVEHIIQKFTLPKYPDLKRHHLAEWELRDMRDTIEYICKVQANACARVYANPPKTSEISDCSMSSAFKRIQNNIKNAEIRKEDYE